MGKKIDINDVKENKKIRLDVHVHNNEMTLKLEKKEENFQISIEYEEKHIVNTDTDFDDLVFNFYSKYVELKTIQYYWKEKLDEMKVKVIYYPKAVDKRVNLVTCYCVFKCFTHFEFRCSVCCFCISFISSWNFTTFFCYIYC